MEFKSNIVLKIGEYLSVKCKSDSIIFEKGKNQIVEIKTDKYKQYQKRNLKAVITNKDNDRYTVKILYFADIHRHSGYSLLDGAAKINDIVSATDYVGALTDHGNMFGFLEYYKKMKEANKQPIIGFEAYTETMYGDKNSNHLLLLAKDEVGFKNLIKLTSLAYENFYNKPHVSYEMLDRYNEGIIATSACLSGEIPRLLSLNDYEKAKKVAMRLKNIFNDDFYLEIQNHNIGEIEENVNKQLIKLSKELDIKLVAATDSHYIEKEDKEVHDIILCLQTKKTLSDPNRLRFDGDGYHIYTAEEMEKRFKGIEEAIDNTLEIAEKCQGLEIELNKINMPVFEVPKGMTDDDFFERLAWEGFDKRYRGKPEHKDEVYRKRLEYEIKVIKQMGFSSYFLIVWDFINYAKNKNIMVGPGRGSAVGSLVAFCLNITDLNPIPYGLLFERFLNPERVSMPDIDIDFCYEKRDEVIDYVKKKYGQQSVSKIVTFGTMAARSAIRDIVRVKDKPYVLGDKIAKTIPMEVGMTLSKALAEISEFKEMYHNDKEVKEIIDIALKIEGLQRHASQHACGVIIAPGSVDNFIPEMMLGNEQKEKEKTSQVTMTEVEELGLLKMDFLGLRTMTVIDKTIKSIESTTGLKIKHLNIPIFDPYVYKDISKGKTFGIFQIESVGMRGFMSELYSDVSKKIRALEKKYNVKGYYNPKVAEDGNSKKFIEEMTDFGKELFERMIAGVSLYRPGPMDYIPNYIQGMKKPNKVIYDTPLLEPILKATYGQIVYQEQVMQIVQTLAGYDLGRADLVRRAMGKKKAEIMKAEKEIFINGKRNLDGTMDVKGCVGNGISKDVAEKIWGKMEDFCKYAFNKSHSAAYSYITLMTAWLKFYYPVDFMTSILNSFINKADKLKAYLAICKEMKIKVLSPNVNKSEEEFSKSGKNIVFGFKGIRNITKVGEGIIRERKSRGNFKSYQDFVERMAMYERIDKKILYGLIFSGALDSFSCSRKAKIEIVPQMLKYAKTTKEKKVAGQIDIFDLIKDLGKLKNIEILDENEFDKRFKLDKEKEYAGFYVTEHPMDEYIKYLSGNNITEISYLISDVEDGEGESIAGYLSGDRVKIAGIINNVKIFYTKKDGKPIYAFSIEDRTGEINGVCFSNKLEQNKDKLIEGKIVIIDGEYKNDERGKQIILQSIVDIESLHKKNIETPKRILIKAKEKSQIDDLKKIINSNKGDVPVYVCLDNKKYKSTNNVIYDLALISKLKNLFGNDVKYVV